MSQFQITRELLNGYCQAGLTVVEMAANITAASNYKCSVDTVRKACAAYGIDLKKKARKSPFVFGDTVQSNVQPNVEQATEQVAPVAEEVVEGLNTQTGVRF